MISTYNKSGTQSKTKCKNSLGTRRAHRLMEPNREPRSKSKCLHPADFQQKCQTHALVKGQPFQ
jgi:hypothetical protein